MKMTRRMSMLTLMKILTCMIEIIFQVLAVSPTLTPRKKNANLIN